MKIINGKQLGFMPNGTVYSELCRGFDPNGANGDMDIYGLHIMCGHDDKWSPVDSGRFNGVLHMLGYVSCYKTEVEEYDDTWRSLTDTDQNDYTENDWVVVYDEKDIRAIIENLQWALEGCPGVE